MATKTNTRRIAFAPQGQVNLGDLRYSISNTRTTFTKLRSRRPKDRITEEETQADFITLVSFVCDLYRDYGDDLVPVQQFHPDAERYEDRGHTCIVSQRAISTRAISNLTRGTTSDLAEDIVVKRPRESILEQKSYGRKSFITELRLRTHPPLRDHPNIVAFKGVAWDFEDDEATKPRPLLLEELAPQRSLDGFWKNYNFVRMTFQSKIDLCLDIADGLAALHGCRIVHGDVKPENILVFPRLGHQDAFMAKLTDFGHSVFAHEGLRALPAFTPQWSAPEVSEDKDLAFDEMIATDVYSYGLVVLSVMIGRSYWGDLEDYEALKKEDTILERAMKLVESEDKKNLDSDFELDTIRLLLSATVQRKARKRSLRRCDRVLRRYKATQKGFRTHRMGQTDVRFSEIPALNVDQTVCIGYQTLSTCSYQLKARITEELRKIANNDNDPRQAVAAWELSICLFDGFGSPRNFRDSSHWLMFAAIRGIPAAEAFCFKLHKAMEIDPQTALTQVADHMPPSNDVTSRFQQLLGIISEGHGIEKRTKMFSQSQTAAAQAPADPSFELASTNSFEDLDEESDADTDVETPIREMAPAVLTEDVIQALKAGEPNAVSEFIARNQDYINCQDAEGNTLLLIAAQSGNYDAMDTLLQDSCLDASICNASQQTVLHMLSSFSDQHVKDLVPRLVGKRADPQHEALPVQYGSSLLSFSTRIRCCPILNAILNDNLILLECLLEEIHKTGDASTCRICESGSRLRRIIAIALSTFRSKALSSILEHVRTHNQQRTLDVSKIEVWSNRELVPIWKTPFQSVIIGTVDLPESFFRAMSYGEGYRDALRSTIVFLMDNCRHKSTLFYSMLREAVLANSLDAVNLILDEAKTRGMSTRWWVITSRTLFPESPLMLAIRYGLRDIFQRLWESYPQLFEKPIKVSCHTCSKCTPFRIAVLLKRESSSPQENHDVNLAHICLSLAVTAAHQDEFFYKFILDHASRKQITHQPTIFDDSLGHQPACFMAQAILTSSFDAASIMSERFPQVWRHRVPRPTYKEFYDSHTSAARLYPKEYASLNWQSLPEYILMIGSYRHCQFVLEKLHKMRPGKTQASSWSTELLSLGPKVEDGRPDWTHCRLTHREYHCLLLGLLAHNREDRQALWDVVAAQVADGHSRSMTYLRLALRHGNNKALVELLDLGWAVNGPFWAYLMTPLRLSTRLQQNLIRMKYHSRLEWDKPSWAKLQTHKAVFDIYMDRQKKQFENFSDLAQKNSETLRARGGKIPRIVTWLRDEAINGWAMIFYLVFYFGILPVAVVFGTGSNWKHMSQGQKLGFMYLYSFLAVINPPFFVFDYYSFRIPKQIQTYAVIIGLMLLQHLIPPILVVGIGWQPFLSCSPSNKDGQIVQDCTNYSFLLPLAVPAFEMGACVAIGCLSIVVMAFSFTFGAAVEIIYILLSLMCGKGVKRGPFGIL